MAFGIKVLDASGNEMLNSADRITRVLGAVSTTSSSGSTTGANLTAGTPWSCVLGASYDSFGKVVSFSGTTMSWTASDFSGTIIYGVY